MPSAAPAAAGGAADYVTPVAATFGVLATVVVVFALRYVVLLRGAALRKRSSAALATDASSSDKPPLSAGGTTPADPLSPMSAVGTGSLFAPHQRAVSRSPANPREPQAWLQAPTEPATPWIAAVGQSFWGRWHGQVEQPTTEDAKAAEAVAALGDENLHDSEGGGQARLLAETTMLALRGNNTFEAVSDSDIALDLTIGASPVSQNLLAVLATTAEPGEAVLPNVALYDGSWSDGLQLQAISTPAYDSEWAAPADAALEDQHAAVIEVEDGESPQRRNEAEP